MTSSAQISSPGQDLANLDLLRTVAVSLVFVGHLMGTAGIRILGDTGHLGVLLFFVHTSFVLMLSLERMEWKGMALVSGFLIRRVFRIYPLSILTVVLAVIAHFPPTSWGSNYVWPGRSDFLSNIFLSQNLTHSASLICVLWSLPYEVQMYALLPVLFLLLRRYKSIHAAATVWFVSTAIAAIEFLSRKGTDNIEFLVTRYFPCFLAGVVAWRLSMIFRPRISGALWVLYLASLVVAYRIVDILRVYGPNFWSVIHGSLRGDHRIWWPLFWDLPRDWIFCALVGLTIPLFNQLRRRRVNAFTKAIAQYSYGIYICHIPILWLCFVRFPLGSAGFEAVLSIALTAITAFALYHLIENPCIQLGKHFANRITSSPFLAMVSHHDVPEVPTSSRN